MTVVEAPTGRGGLSPVRQFAAPEPTDLAGADRISTGLSRLFRVNARMRAEAMTEIVDGREFGTLVLLHRLVESGPARAGALAERLFMDPSQVSRAVAALVRERFVERRADPDDGRATLLVVTDDGRAVGERFARAKTEHIASLLADWDAADTQTFAAGLERFVDCMEQSLAARDVRWRRDAPPPDPRPAGSTPHDTSGGDGAPGHPTSRPTAGPGVAE